MAVVHPTTPCNSDSTVKRACLSAAAQCARLTESGAGLTTTATQEATPYGSDAAADHIRARGAGHRVSRRLRWDHVRAHPLRGRLPPHPVGEWATCPSMRGATVIA